jgi:type IV secretion system protein VirB8
MNQMSDDELTDYYRAAESWTVDRERASTSSRKWAWFVAGAFAAVALAEGIALIMLLPLKTVVPYTLLVDKQTGFVQELKPLERQIVAPDAALARSFLAQYVIAREGFDIDSMRDTYQKVALWSAGDARSRYIADMQASNPLSPLATLPRRALVEVQIRSISSLNADTSLVRFSTVRTDPGGQPQDSQTWAAVLKYRFSGEAMSAAHRMINPLGFQVVRYRRDAEVLPDASAQQPQPSYASGGMPQAFVPAGRIMPKGRPAPGPPRPTAMGGR